MNAGLLDGLPYSNIDSSWRGRKDPGVSSEQRANPQRIGPKQQSALLAELVSKAATPEPRVREEAHIFPIFQFVIVVIKELAANV